MNKLTADKCREQFEEWLKSTGQNPPYATKRGYWEIWKASREALEVALPILEQQEKGDDGWIEWHGGECPVAPGVHTEGKSRNGGYGENSHPELWNWSHCNSSLDIIAYRVIK